MNYLILRGSFNRRVKMKYYLLSEQDVYEICTELEKFLYEMKEVIKSKQLEENEEENEEGS